jgi:hypothetical protein
MSSPIGLKAAGSGGLKKVDEIEFHPNGMVSFGGTYFGTIQRFIMYIRDELASALGVQNLFRVRQGGGLSMAVY